MTLWTPANLATLPSHWWDAADNATLTLNGGTLVSGWANKGSAGGTVTQATAASQPTRSSSSFGGRQALFFDGTDDFFGSTFAVGAVFRLYAVVNYLSGKVDQLILGGENTFVPLASGPSSGSATNNQVWRVNNVNTIGPQTVWQNAVAASVGTRSQIWSQMVGGQRIFSIRNLPAFTGYRLFEGGNSIFRPNGFVGEILLVPEAGLTQADDDLITGYLAWKWGLEGSLPADHPYKTAAPTAGPSANNATAASAFDLAGSSASAIAIAAQGAGSLPLAGSAVTQVRITASAAGSLELGGSAQGTVATAATASGSLPLTGSAVAGGPGAVNASASGSIGFTGSAAAGVNITASVSGAISLTGSALAGAPDNGAVGAGSIALAGSSATSVAIRATGAGQVGLGGSSAVSVDIRAAAAGAIALTGAATVADRARVPSLVFSVPRESRLFLVEREQRVFAVAREQRIFSVIREAA